MKPEEFVHARIGSLVENVMHGLRNIMSVHHRSAGQERYCEACIGEWHDEDGNRGHAEYPCETVRIIGGMWADHPDYRTAFPSD